MHQLAELKRTMDYCTPALIQAIGLTLLTSGRYDTHNRHMRAVYKTRMDTLITAMGELLVSVGEKHKCRYGHKQRLSAG